MNLNKNVEVYSWLFFFENEGGLCPLVVIGPIFHYKSRLSRGNAEGGVSVAGIIVAIFVDNLQCCGFSEHGTHSVANIVVVGVNEAGVIKPDFGALNKGLQLLKAMGKR